MSVATEFRKWAKPISHMSLWETTVTVEIHSRDGGMLGKTAKALTAREGEREEQRRVFSEEVEDSREREKEIFTSR